jgi:hypothetical protein
MKIGLIVQIFAGISVLALPVSADRASQFCPITITEHCLADIADRVIADQSDEDDRAALALLYVDVTESRLARSDLTTINADTQDGDWRSLRRSGRALGNTDQFDEAHDLLWAAAQTRANDPNERVKILDILLIAEDAADIDDLALARAVHELAAQHLPGTLDGFVPFSEEIRLARLLALYGWPEVAHSFLDTLYPKLREMPTESQTYGYTLTRLIEIFILVSHDVLLAQAEADLAVFLQKVDPEICGVVQKEYVASLARAGRVASAQEYAAAHGIEFSEALRNASHFFLQYGSEYYPGIPDDILRRFELMLAAIDDPEIKGAFMTNLASQMIQDKQYTGIQELLDRVEDTKARSEMVFSLMTYHAREKEDAKTAADLFFAEDVSLTPRFPRMGTFLQRYPISLTARGLLEDGDMDRSVLLADLVLELWLNDQSERRSLDTLLIGALAKVDEPGRVDMWIAASDDPTHRISVVIEAASYRARAGLPVDRDKVTSFSEDLLPLITGIAPPSPSWWPENRPYPSPREEAQQMIQRLDAEIVTGLAEKGSLDDARQAFADIQNMEPYPWLAQFALADAEVADGQVERAHKQRLAVLDLLLSGQIEAGEMPTILDAIHP